MSGDLRESPWPWVALYNNGVLTYTTAAHHAWADRVAQIGCDHPAVEVNGAVEMVTCPQCRGDLLDMSLDGLARASQALQRGESDGLDG